MNNEQLHAYLDGELLPEEREAIERALAQDSALAEEYTQLVALDAAIENAWGASDLIGPESSGDAHELGPRDLGPRDLGPRDLGQRIASAERRARRGRLIALTGAAAGIAAGLLLVFLPSGIVPMGSSEAAADEYFTVDEQAGYVYWETDGETFGTGDLVDLEDQILDVLGAT